MNKYKLKTQLSVNPFLPTLVFFSLAFPNRVPNPILVCDFFGGRKSMIRVPPYVAPFQINFHKHKKPSLENLHLYWSSAE